MTSRRQDSARHSMAWLPPCAIRGYACCNALGLDSETALARLFSATSPLEPSAAWGCEPALLGALPLELPPLPRGLARHDSRSARLLGLGLRQLQTEVSSALQRWGPERVALLVGSTTSGIDVSERVYPAFTAAGRLPNDRSFKDRHGFEALLAVARGLTAITGPGYVVSTACSSSAKILGSAQRLLSTGHADAVLAVGVDALCRLTVGGFKALSVLATSACRPFCDDSPGMNLGEGVAALLLERAASHEQAAVCVLGVGESSDAYHMTAPEPSGAGAERAMRDALRQAGIDADDIDYINAHGTGTAAGDRAERAALSRVFPIGTPVSSTKQLTGHLLGAAGATEVVFCAEALAQKQVPANGASAANLQYATSNSLAFGGSNVSVVLGPAVGARTSERHLAREASRVFVTGLAFWAPGFPSLEAWCEKREATSDRATPPAASLLAPRARGRASELTRLFAELLEQLAEGSSARLEQTPVVYASAYGEMATTLRLLQMMHAPGAELSPLAFQASTHNTAAGLLSIATHNTGFYTAVTAGSCSVAMSLLEATAWLQVHGGEVFVLIAEEAWHPFQGEVCRHEALGLGFALSAEPSSRQKVLGSLSAPNGARGEPRARRTDRYAAHPHEGGLDLLEALLEQREGYTCLDPSGEARWSVKLSVSPSRRPR